jgi:hypothetical protein
MYESDMPSGGVSSPGSFGGQSHGGADPFHGSISNVVGTELPFRGDLGPFGAPVDPASGGDDLPEDSFTLLSMSVDFSRTKLSAEGRATDFDPL